VELEPVGEGEGGHIKKKEKRYSQDTKREFKEELWGRGGSKKKRTA